MTSIGEKNLFSINSYQTPSRQKLRSFGLVLASGFFVIGMWPTVFRHRDPTHWAVGLSLLFAAVGILIPHALKYVHRAWMTIGNVLGWINSKVLLTLVYYVVVTPLSLIMRLVGHDPMNRKLDKGTETYRVNRQSRPASHMRHQF
jgi:saxitoxin biosynthesis operon SxtJ-like protein